MSTHNIPTGETSTRDRVEQMNKKLASLRKTNGTHRVPDFGRCFPKSSKVDTEIDRGLDSFVGGLLLAQVESLVADMHNKAKKPSKALKQMNEHLINLFKNEGLKVWICHNRNKNPDGTVSNFGGHTIVGIFDEDDLNTPIAVSEAKCRDDDNFQRRLSIFLALAKMAIHLYFTREDGTLDEIYEEAIKREVEAIEHSRDYKNK